MFTIENEIIRSSWRLLVYFKLEFYTLQQAEKSSSNLEKKSSLWNLIFETGELQKSSADR